MIGVERITRALTLWRPWPWAILHAGKRVENRGWPPPRWVIGHRIALHAGKRFDAEAARCMNRLAPLRTCPPSPEQPTGIVGVARVVRCLEAPTGGLYDDSIERWFVGPYGWVLDDVVALPRPIEWPGAQGLWHMPPALEQQILEQLS